MTSATENMATLLLLSLETSSEEEVKRTLLECRIQARYNTAPIPPELETWVMGGRMIIPARMQDTIFDPLDYGERTDMDLTPMWSARERKSIEKHGGISRLIAAAYMTADQMISLQSKLTSKNNYAWCWHQWASLGHPERLLQIGHNR